MGGDGVLLWIPQAGRAANNSNQPNTQYPHTGSGRKTLPRNMPQEPPLFAPLRLILLLTLHFTFWSRCIMFDKNCTVIVILTLLMLSWFASCWLSLSHICVAYKCGCSSLALLNHSWWVYCQTVEMWIWVRMLILWLTRSCCVWCCAECASNTLMWKFPLGLRLNVWDHTS